MKLQQTFPPIPRRGVVEDIIESIKAALINGDLRPGQKLPSESELVDQFGVGRGAVREAMKMLAAMGVVEIRRGNGTYIAESTSPSLLNPLVFTMLLQQGGTKEILELRTLVEVGYCQLASQNHTPADLIRIREAAAAWQTYAQTKHPDLDDLARLDLDFHFALLDATHNPLVILVGHTVEELFFASIRETLSNLEGLQWGIEGHHRIIEAVQGGSMEEVRQAVVASLGYWSEVIRDRPNT